MHVEDCHLASINYLYTGEKVWIIVEPQSGSRLEEKLAATGIEKGCSQFLRHSARYVPRPLLDEWGISYKVVRQLSGEIIVTFPGAYHQGFSTGFTCAEAVNYAEADWSTAQYQFCSDRCPDGSIQAPMMALLNEGDSQHDQPATSEEANPSGNEKEAAGSNSTKRKASDAILPPTTKEAAAKRPHLRKQPQQLKDMTLSPKFSGALDEFKDVTRALLFCTIGSPEAMVQLRKACAALRDRATLPPASVDRHRTGTGNTGNTTTTTTTTTTITACQAVLSLDRLDNQDFAVQVLRRFYLVRLVRWRKNAEVAATARQQNQRAVRKCAQERLPRYETLVLEDLMAQAYPYLTDKNDEGYKSRYKSLQNRISSGNNWYLLAEEFGEGIIALVPTSDVVPNSSVEKLARGPFIQLIEALKKHRGGFLRDLSARVGQHLLNVINGEETGRKFLFEDEKCNLLEEAEDSKRLIELCDLDEV
ncbi:Lysine-specific demethylase 4D [Lasiodiplodia theobromae]|uniref:Lysine-specific demethylase 4D n=1 Tax=Lasiodiplodia theobromae TaxID=45133 RepID=A0A5N5DEY4_9PEZI|nr:Lysine-specific demethylase 4D [Lasiodiplodia theobromae]